MDNNTLAFIAGVLWGLGAGLLCSHLVLSKKNHDLEAEVIEDLDGEISELLERVSVLKGEAESDD